MAQRMSKADELIRLETLLKGFYLDDSEGYRKLSEFCALAHRPWGSKDVAASIAFNLGWDRDRVLCFSAMPEWVREETEALHEALLCTLCGVPIK